MKPRNSAKIHGGFVALLTATMRADAWRAMSHGARSLYVLLKTHYNRKLGNGVYVSTRDAAEQLGSNRNFVCRWFRELEYYGFIRMVSPAYHGVGSGVAPHWRLTDEKYLDASPTREFEKWDGVKFRVQKSPKHYLSKNKSRGTTSATSVAPVVGPLAAPQTPPAPDSGTISGSIETQEAGTTNGSISSLTTPLPEWRTPELEEIELTAAERAELERLADLQRLACNRPSPKQINNYGLALGLMSSNGSFVSKWTRH